MPRPSLTLTRYAAFTAAAALVCGGVAMAAPAAADPVGGTIVVTSLADTLDAGTLRSAFEAAENSSGDDVIRIDVTGTIALATPLPTITNGGIDVVGPGSDRLVIVTPSGDLDEPGFTYAPTVAGTARISGLTLTGGGASIVGNFFNLPEEGDAGIEIVDVVIDGATTEVNRPGLLVDAGLNRASVLVSDSTIKNFPIGSRSAGAAQIVGAGQVTIEDSTFDNNQSGQISGALLLLYTEATTISGSTFSHNSAPDFGGAVAVISTPSLAVVQSTFSQNESGQTGAALFIADVADASIAHSTITGNVDNGTEGSAVTVVGNGLTVDSSIVSGNTGPDTSVPDLSRQSQIGLRAADTSAEVPVQGDADGEPIAPLIEAAAAEPVAPDSGTVSHSLIGQSRDAFDPALWTLSAESIFGVDAQLGPLADNGGNTLTHLPAATSPAVNAGDASTLDGITLDQRSAPRVSGGSVDIGSVEVQAAPIVPAAVVTNAAARLPDTGFGAEGALLALAGLLIAGVAMLGFGRFGARRSGTSA